VDSPGILADEAMEPRHISRPTAQDKAMGIALLIAESNLVSAAAIADRLYVVDRGARHLSQRIRVSLQSPLLPACFVRNPARTGCSPRARKLLGYRQTRQSSKARAETIGRARREHCAARPDSQPRSRFLWDATTTSR